MERIHTLGDVNHTVLNQGQLPYLCTLCVRLFCNPGPSATVIEEEGPLHQREQKERQRSFVFG